MQTLIFPDKRLKQKSEEITNYDSSLRKIATELLTYCKLQNGLGMAAPQTGNAIRLVVINKSIDSLPWYPEILINPIIKNGEGTSKFKEGCLSVPGIFAWVTRFNSFDLSYFTLDGQEQFLHIKDVKNNRFGTIIQHEVDHLDGIEFIDRLTSFEYDKIVNKLNKLRKKR